jgi:hypothetical protein
VRVGALGEPLGTPSAPRRRGRRAWRDARERFSWPALAEDLAGIFDEVADVADGRVTNERAPVA